MLLLAAALVHAVLAAPTAMPITISINASAWMNTVSPSYVSFNFDWHLDTEEFPAWLHASAMVIDLTNPLLRTLASALAPGHLRIGGSEGDNITYAVRGTECSAATNPFCLTMGRWAELNAFARDTGLTIAFGLNAMKDRKANGNQNMSNIADFLAATFAMGDAAANLFAFEYGNELEYKTNVTAYAEDVLALQHLIDSIWGAAKNKPLLIANDENPDASYWDRMLPVAGPALHAATWHLYCGYGLDPKLPSDAWSTTFLSCPSKTAAPMLVSAEKYRAAGGRVWVGETAMAWHLGGGGFPPPPPPFLFLFSAPCLTPPLTPPAQTVGPQRHHGHDAFQPLVLGAAGPACEHP